MILPLQIILVWVTISALTGAISGLLISEAKNWLYILGNTLVCAFVGIIAGGIFVALTDGFNWEFYSFLIPFIIAGAISFVTGAYLREQLPKPSRAIRPAVVALELIVIIGLCIASVIPGGQPSSVPATEDVENVVYALDIENIESMPSNTGLTSIGDTTIIKIDTSSSLFKQLEEHPLIPIDIDGYHSSINYPTRIAEDPNEGDYMGWCLEFSVDSGSPVKWKQPVMLIYVWGDVNGNGEFDAGDVILWDHYIKTPSAATHDTASILTGANYRYSLDGDPLCAIYYYVYEGTLYMWPICFADWTLWKDDSEYTFANTPEGFTPPSGYNGHSYYEENGEPVWPETLDSWFPVEIGQTRPLIGEIYCPSGMADIASDWHLSCIAFDYAYSLSTPVATHDMHFTVGGPQAPSVSITHEYWVAAGLLAFFGVASIVATKFGKKLI